jgi:hypothetical protein
MSKKNYRSIPMIEKLKIRRTLKQLASDIKDFIVSQAGAISFKVIEDLSSLGVLEVEKFRSPIWDSDAFTEEYFVKIVECMNKSYPIFDEASNGLIQAADREGVVNLSDSNIFSAKHSALVDNIIVRLPSFSFAPIDEIVDIKKHLGDSIIRFRSQMLKYTEEINNIPWSEDFFNDCSIIYHREVAPTILEIDELTKENGFVKNLAVNILSDKTTLGSIVVCLAAGGLASRLIQLPVDKGLFGIAASNILSNVIKTYDDYSKGQQQIKKNNLYFYHQAGNLLSSTIKR